MFAEEPKNPFLAVEGDNVTLEWRYSFGKGNSLSQMLFEKEWQIVDKYSPFLRPWIKPSYRGHILNSIGNSIFQWESNTVVNHCSFAKGWGKLHL